MANVVTLVVVDHHLAFAEGLGMILDAEDDLAVLDVADHAGRAVELAAKHRPTVLLLDAHLPVSGLGETLAAAKAASPLTKVLVLSDHARQETIAAVVASGADGFVPKDGSSRQVVTAIRKLVEGEPAMVAAAEPPRPGHGLTVELRLQRLSDRDPSVELRFRTLSGREREILGLLANGWSNRRIAEECRVSFFTVRSHVQSVLVKLGVHSKLEAVALAAQHGVLAAAGGSAVWDRHSA